MERPKAFLALSSTGQSLGSSAFLKSFQPGDTR